MEDIKDIQNKLKAYTDIWQKQNFDLNYYFENIFELSLKALKYNMTRHNIKLTLDDNTPLYNALFIPVGLSLEVTALVSAIFKPDFLCLAYSESMTRFFRKKYPILERYIKNYCPETTITQISTSNRDQKRIEQDAVRWTEEMTEGYGIQKENIAFDLTGGTKPMSIGVQNAAQALGMDAYYLSVEYDEALLFPIPGTENLEQMPRQNPLVDNNMVFVIMPFSDTYNNLYEYGINQPITNMGLNCVRVDKEIFQGGIMDRIRDNIVKARTIVADLSEKNLNVYYELGLAHAMNKDIIMLADDTDNLPFDIKHLRVLVYNKRDIKKLSEDLTREVKTIHGFPE